MTGGTPQRDDPTIDGRRRSELAGDVEDMVPYYVEEWEPMDGDVGSTLLSLFSELAEEVTERLDRVPEKHRAAFYDTLGFERQPPTPARLPLSVDIADRAEENVTLPAGTVAVAEPSDSPEQPFEVPEVGAMDATPANLVAVYSVNPEHDGIYDHAGAVDGVEPTTLFPEAGQPNRQAHAFYLGDAARLAVGSGSTIHVELATGADRKLLVNDCTWEYFGERTVDGETVEDWHTLNSDSSDGDTDAGRLDLAFEPKGPLTAKAVDGVETKWIRCRVPDDVSPTTREDLFDVQLSGSSTADDPPARLGAAASGISPDKLLANDVPVGEGSIKPFGDAPRQRDAFYVASTDALTKSGAVVKVHFNGRPPQRPRRSRRTKSGAVVKVHFNTPDSEEPPHEPVLSWEYFDGEGWSRLETEGEDFGDTTGGLQKSGTFTFEVPRDLAQTTVAGHEGHWIRVRLVGGAYGTRKSVDVSASGEPAVYEFVESFDPPTYEEVVLDFRQYDTPDHAVAENNLQFGDGLQPDRTGSYRPFRPVPVEEQSLFLGFDAPLRDGPINLLFDVADVSYPRTYHPQVRWERHDPETGLWTRPDVRDGTNGLTERGIVGLTFAEATTAHRAFGEDRHWVRARVTGPPFGVESKVDEEPSARSGEEGACGRFLETVPPAGTPRRHRPSVRGIYANATWAWNRRSIDGESLGSSDGTVDQTFSLGTDPVTEATVWVDELAVLSEGARLDLAERWPERTALETDDGGEPIAFWVRWERQPDLLDSGPEDRHYTLDPIEGEVSFGDGTRGKIPPRGTDNVRASYVTGGGTAGNVPAGSVTGFRQSVGFVDSITNPLAGAAGADAEATEHVTDRAARELRDRNRAVAPADFERHAMAASRELARARCLRGMDDGGAYRPGWVTLLIVPRSGVRKPQPSATLRRTVERAVAERAPIRLVGPEADRLVVRGPSYVSVAVEVELAAAGGSVSALEDRARGTVADYLHPLTGGPDGAGWDFGEVPCRSDFYELLEGVDGVDHVKALAVTYESDRAAITVTEGRSEPDTSSDVLVHAGTQEITATLRDAEGGR